MAGEEDVDMHVDGYEVEVSDCFCSLPLRHGVRLYQIEQQRPHLTSLVVVTVAL